MMVLWENDCNTKINSLKPGETFMYKRDVYLMLADPCVLRAANIATGSVSLFEPNLEVEKLNSRVFISHSK